MGATKGGGPNLEKRWGPEGWGAQNFALVFSSNATIFFLSSLSWVLSWNFGGVGPGEGGPAEGVLEQKKHEKHKEKTGTNTEEDKKKQGVKRVPPRDGSEK